MSDVTLTDDEQGSADQRRFGLSPHDWTEFVRVLSGPAEEVQGLRELLSQPSVLDER